MNDLEQAFAALRTYERGSARAALLPLDQAVSGCPADKRKELERQLVGTLAAGVSVVAREYLCSKLALIGSDVCVPALAALLADPQLSTAARNALEAIPSAAATTALRENLPKLQGLQKVGVIHSLGTRRDSGSVRALVALLDKPELEIAGAAAAALGEIATPKAGKALKAFLPKAPVALRAAVADAVLTCAERLLASGRKSDAQALYRALADSSQPAHVQLAATRGLAGAGRD